MNKDVIYIDVEDDITAIIGKVKGAKEKVIALVPPKRIGILQSAVNLQLLARAAKQDHKHLVLISNNSALMSLAAAAKIPVAKNLQSKPEIPEIAALAVDNGDDIIDGSQLPVGDHAKLVGNKESERDQAASSIAKAAPPALGETPSKPKPKGGPKVPNFSSFRKKMIFAIGGGVLLIGLLVWAIFFAPRATVIITARTTDTSVNTAVTLGDNVDTKLSTATIKTTTKSLEQPADLTFDATGTKEVGERAEGKVVFENCEDFSTITVAEGTTVTANGKQYTTQASVSVPGGSGTFADGCSSPGKSSPVTIVAKEIGSEYNAAQNTAFRVAGHPNYSTSSKAYFRAVASTDIDGGSKKEIKVVTQGDIDRAISQVSESQNAEDIKKQLSSQFDDNTKVIDATFLIDKSSLKSEPGVDGEAADGKAKLTGKIVYSLKGVSQAEARAFLDAYFAKQLENENDQRLYDNGAGNITFTNVTQQDGDYKATITATGKVGPKIEDQQIKEMAKGKRYGDIQSSIEKITGVEDVDVKFWPFWVSSAPNDTNRISIEFKLNETK